MLSSLCRLLLHLNCVLAENIVRTVETLAAQKRVLVCPICDRRLVQIEQMVRLTANEHNWRRRLPVLVHCRIAPQVFDTEDHESTNAPEDKARAAEGQHLVEHWAPNLAHAHDHGAAAAERPHPIVRAAHCVCFSHAMLFELQVSVRTASGIWEKAA